MRIVKLLASFLILSVLICPVLPASGFESQGLGLKARGLSGAFRSIADDWTAANYNPAGYAYTLDDQLGVSLSILHHRNTITPDYRWGSEWASGMYNDETLYNAHEYPSTPSGGFIIRTPYLGEAVVGLSIYQPFDYQITWNLFSMNQPGFIYNDSIHTPSDQWHNNLDVVAFQLTVARLHGSEDKLSLGIGLQLLRADLLYNELILRDNPMPAPLSDGPWYKIPEWTHNDGSGWGFGAKFGALYKPMDRLNLGFTASWASEITISGDASLEYYMPEIAQPSAISGSVEDVFSNGKKIVNNADFETKLKLPTTFGLGVSFLATEKLTVSVDAEYSQWSRFEGFEFAYSNYHGLRGSADTVALANEFFSADVSRPADWDNTVKVMGGLIYDASSVITLLAGASLDQSVTRTSALISPMFVDPGSKLGYSGGVIFHINQWDIGMVVNYAVAEDFENSQLVDINDDGVIDNFGGAFEANTYETVLAFNYRF